jgi:hypothetical protein
MTIARSIQEPRIFRQDEREQFVIVTRPDAENREDHSRARQNRQTSNIGFRKPVRTQ